MKIFKKVVVLALSTIMILNASLAVFGAESENIASQATPAVSSSFDQQDEIDNPGSTIGAGHFNPVNAIDGDLGTEWAPSWEATPWYELDFGKEVTVQKIVIYGRAGASETVDSMKEMDILFDEVVVKSLSDMPANFYATPITITFDEPQTVEVIKFEVIDGIANCGFTEIQVFASADDTADEPSDDEPSEEQPGDTTDDNNGGDSETPVKTGDISMLYVLCAGAASVLGGLKLKKKIK